MFRIRLSSAYFQSDEPQANAILIDAVSVIWITKGMLGLLWNTSDRLSTPQWIGVTKIKRTLE